MWRFMNVIERFSSIEGEGTRQGSLCSFLRLYDCNLRCVYCDTTYSYGDEVDYEVQSVEDVADALRQMGNRYITITGGEPLLQADEVEQLIDVLSRETTPFGPYESTSKRTAALLLPSSEIMYSILTITNVPIRVPKSPCTLNYVKP